VQVLRVVVACVGALLAALTALSVLRMLVIPRPRRGAVSLVVDSLVDVVFHGLAHRSRDYEARDRLLAGQAPAYLVAMLATWLLANESLA